MSLIEKFRSFRRRRADRTEPISPTTPAGIYVIPWRFRSLVLKCPRFQRDIISPDVHGFRFCPYCGHPISELDFDEGCHTARTTEEILETVKKRREAIH